VPECPPVLIWNWARLASTSALVSDRPTPEPEVWSAGAWLPHLAEALLPPQGRCTVRVHAYEFTKSSR
jgi:hypothetical protein